MLPMQVWGIDSIKSAVTVLEEGDFTEEGDGFDRATPTI